MKKVLITGASGFIGSSFLKLHEELKCFEISVISRGSYDEFIRKFPLTIIRRENFLSYQEFERGIYFGSFFKEIDVFIHLAAIAHIFKNIDRDQLKKVNEKYLLQLLDVLPINLEKIIFLSSYSVSLLEKKSLIDLFEYAESKKNAEDFIRRYQREKFKSCDVFFLRPPLVYGANAPGNFDRLIKLLKLPLPIPFASFDFIRPMIHVENLSMLIIDLIKLNKTGQTESHVIEVCDPWEETFSIFTRRLRKQINGRSILIPFPISFLKILLTSLGKKKTFLKLTMSFKIDYQIIIDKFDWKPRIYNDRSLDQIK